MISIRFKFARGTNTDTIRRGSLQRRCTGTEHGRDLGDVGRNGLERGLYTAPASITMPSTAFVTANRHRGCH